MQEVVSALLEHLTHSNVVATNILSWGAPVPTFGDLQDSRIATLGLNPSNREFVDESGNELIGEFRRFHTLRSLGLNSWKEAQDGELQEIVDLCNSYFSRNPYNTWFGALDAIINGAGASYYPGGDLRACHLDLVPFATECKWTELSTCQRNRLLELGANTLGELVRESCVELLVLNGKTVIIHLDLLSDVDFHVTKVDEWTLPRKSGAGVAGYEYVGHITRIGNIDLGKTVSVLGFNHNIQSSFGVTNFVRSSIRDWLGSHAEAALA